MTKRALFAMAILIPVVAAAQVPATRPSDEGEMSRANLMADIQRLKKQVADLKAELQRTQKQLLTTDSDRERLKAELAKAEAKLPAAQKPAPKAAADAPAERQPLAVFEVGFARVSVVAAAVEKVALRTISGESQSADPLLAFLVVVENTSLDRKLDYRTFRGATLAVPGTSATLKDNVDNVYKRVTFGLGSYPKLGVQDGDSIYPGKRLADVLVFEAPVSSARTLVLDLPLANIGGSGTQRVEIPLSSVLGSAEAGR